MVPLPIDCVIADIRAGLAGNGTLVLQAPPGAGKTTRVPPALLDEPWLAGRRILMLEPRRLAARAAAARMAAERGEPVGATIGYRIRMDTKVGPSTRIEVVTEGILARMLQDDPALAGFGLVIFDEFHERSLDGDFGLALCLEARAVLRPDLRLLVMSATIAAKPIAELLDAPVLVSEGRAFPVETRFLERPAPRRFEESMAQAIRRALAEEREGDLLAFLPGTAEIRRTQTMLEGEGIDAQILPLFGDLPALAQDRALAPAAGGSRKVVLATAVAETSLTIDGVRIVVDGGLMRLARFDSGSGMTRLVTLPVSRASADQRRGRAGRTGPGICYRLWSEAEDRALSPFTPPEILEADLARLALELALWGTQDAGQLSWLDAPPAAALGTARRLLFELGALDEGGAITVHGRAMARLPMHPRLAHMILMAHPLGLAGLACDLAALLGERDVLKAAKGCRDADLRLRIEAMRTGEGFDPRHGLSLDRGALARARASAKDWRRRVGARQGDGDTADAGLVLAFAYPDRIARRRPGGPARYLMAGGQGAFFAEPEPLAAEEWLVAAELDGNQQDARIFLAAPLAKAAIDEHFAQDIRTEEFVAWNRRERVVEARSRRRLFELVLDDRPLARPDPHALARAMADGVRNIGLECLPWNPEVERLRQRVAFLARIVPEDGWPDWSNEALLITLDDWLLPHLGGMGRATHLDRLDLGRILSDSLPWEQRRSLDTLAPTHIEVPSGSRVPLDYSADIPVLAVRLQEMFGCAATPSIAGGRVAVLLHLLSPARRPVQVTADLAGFWAGSYKAVKADLKGQYPRHWWPDDPMQAEPTARAKPRR